MTSLVLAVALFAPQSPVNERVEAFLKGDSAARKDLLALGALAILPLQGVRERKPEAVDGLVFELKKAAAWPRESSIIGRLQSSVDITLKDEPFGPAVVGGLLKAGVPVFLDPFDQDILKSRPVNVDVKGTVRQFLDQLCLSARVDYGFFHNHIVIALPDRLWPAGAKKTIPELKGDALAKVKSLIDQLGAGSREERLEAMDDLSGMGLEILPLLESGAKRKDASIASRCGTLLERLRPAASFGAPGVAKQLRTGLQDDSWKKIRSIKLDVSLSGTPVSELLTMIRAFTQIPFEIESDDAKLPVTLQGKGQPVADLLALATQGHRLDFLFTDKGIAIDAKEAVEARLDDGKK
jgi:hypothetical protein